MADGAVSFTLEHTPEEFRNIIMENLEDYGIFPVEISIGSEHAAFLEFGTGPAKGIPYRAIREWYDSRHPVGTLAERRRIAGGIANKIARSGTEPHPFIRPALEKLRDVGADYLMDRGRDMMDIGDWLIAEMRNNLEKNDSNWRFDVYGSMSCHRDNDGWADRMDGDGFDVDRIMDGIRAESQ